MIPVTMKEPRPVAAGAALGTALHTSNDTPVHSNAQEGAALAMRLREKQWGRT